MITILAIVAISAVTVGILTLLAPLHHGLSGLNFLGTKGGVSLIAVGGIALLAVVFGACYSNKKQVITQKPAERLGYAHASKQLQKQHTKPTSNYFESEQSFNQAIQIELQQMSAHLLPTQKNIITQCVHQAIQCSNPTHRFNILIDNEISKGNWGQEKASIIKENFNPILQKSPPIARTKQPVLEHDIKQLAKQGEYICFYKGGTTQFLENFAFCPNGISIWGKRFACAEAAFQWAKFSQNFDASNQNTPDGILMQELHTCNGQRAFDISRILCFNHQPPSNWHIQIKGQVMWEILTAKFNQNPVFKSCLDATESTFLLEHNDKKGKDQDWSDDYDGNGKNLLGRMLMAIRDHQPRPQDNPNESEKVLIRKYALDANHKNLSARIK